MINLLRRLRHFFGRHHSPQFKLLVVILVAAALPFTVYVAQQVQELRQRASSPCDDAGYTWYESEFQCGGPAHYNCDNVQDGTYANSHKVYVHKYDDGQGNTYYFTEDQGVPANECNNACAVGDSNGQCDDGTGKGTWHCRYDDNGNAWECKDVVQYTPTPEAGGDCDGSISVSCGNYPQYTVSANWNITGGSGCNVFVRTNTGDRTISTSCSGNWSDSDAEVRNSDYVNYELYASNGNPNGNCYNKRIGQVNQSCPAPATTLQDCTSGKECSGACTPRTNTCGAGNGTQTGCVWTTGSNNCRRVDAPDITNCNAASNCSGTNVCSNGQCVAPSTNPGQSVTCWTCDCGQKRSQNRSGSCQQGESATEPGTCPAPDSSCSNFVPSATTVVTAGSLAVKIPMQSIGTGSPSGPQKNSSPQRTTRDVTISFYTANNAPTALTPVTTALTYNNAESMLVGTFNLASIPQGTYRIKVSMKGAVDRKSAAVNLPHSGPLLFSELLMCNITDDDTVDIQDYSMFTTCFEGKANSVACGNFKQTADCNDDGQVTLEDYVWLFKNLGRQDE